MDDLSTFKELYLKTAKENIVSLQNAIKLLSANKADANAIDLAYMSSHTINGKSAVMGNVEISVVAKKMEDLLDLVKKGQSTITDEVILFLQQSTDLLSQYFLSIEATKNNPSASLANAQNLQSPQTQPKVLIVEDDVFFQKFYSTKLGEQNFNIAVAQDGQEGLTKMAEFMPDIVLLDIIMPKKNGFEFLEAIGKNPSNPPIIVFSSLGQEQDVEKAKSLGASDYINKSFYDFDNLLTKIQTMLKK